MLRYGYCVTFTYIVSPHQFVKVAMKKGLHVRQVMNEVKAAAMWSKSNVTLSQA